MGLTKNELVPKWQARFTSDMSADEVSTITRKLLKPGCRRSQLRSSKSFPLSLSAGLRSEQGQLAMQVRLGFALIPKVRFGVVSPAPLLKLARKFLSAKTQAGQCTVGATIPLRGESPRCSSHRPASKAWPHFAGSAALSSLFDLGLSPACFCSQNPQMQAQPRTLDSP